MFEKYLEMPAAKWLQLIENEELKNRVITNTLTYPGNPNFLCSNIGEAIFHSFDWEKTEEGEFYWLNVYNSKIRLNEPALSSAKERTKRKDLLIIAGITLSTGIASFWIL